MPHLDKTVQYQWYYNKAHHGKGPMDDVGEAIKGVVSGLVKSNKIVINTAEELQRPYRQFNQSTFPKMMT